MHCQLRCSVFPLSRALLTDCAVPFFVLTLCLAVRGPEARAEPRAEEEGRTAAAAAAEQTGADHSLSADGTAAESAAHGTVALTGQCGQTAAAAHDGRKEEVRRTQAVASTAAPALFFVFLSPLPSLIHARMSFYFLFAIRESIEQRIILMHARESIENLARAAGPAAVRACASLVATAASALLPRLSHICSLCQKWSALTRHFCSTAPPFFECPSARFFVPEEVSLHLFHHLQTIFPRLFAHLPCACDKQHAHSTRKTSEASGAGRSASGLRLLCGNSARPARCCIFFFILSSDFKQIQTLGADAHLNTCFKHFM